MQDSKHFAWNFLNIGSVASTGSTVEWRMPPGVTTPEECFPWVVLAVAFLNAARRSTTEEALRSGVYDRDRDALLRFVRDPGTLPETGMFSLETLFQQTWI
jgi:hypothetical protein